MAASATTGHLFHFYLPPMKKTSPVNFPTRFKDALKSQEATDLMQELYTARENLIALFERQISPSDELPNIVAEAVQKFVSLFRGVADAASPLRRCVVYTWTNTVGEVSKEARADSLFDLFSMLMNEGLWYLTFCAATVAVHQQPTEDEQKKMYQLLLKASSIFSYLESQVSTLEGAGLTDLSAQVLAGFASLAAAEAQEITVRRAITKGNTANLICKLSRDLMNKYATGYSKLAHLETPKASAGRVHKLRLYCNYKRAFYGAFTHYYAALGFQAQEQPGNAIRCLDESVKHFTEAAAQSVLYVKEAPKTGTVLIPQESEFQEKLKHDQEQFKRENDFITNERIPPTVPTLPDPQSLLQLTTYELPTRSGLWTDAVFGNINSSAIPVEEAPPPETTAASSGGRDCVIL